MTTIDANQIIVQDRQRRDMEELDDGFVESVNKRLIHPIVLRIGDDSQDPILVVGGRRLAALIKGGTTDLIENTHFRFLDKLSPREARILELEENVKRSDLTWRDHTYAVGQLHDIWTKHEKDWSVEKTRTELNLKTTQLQMYLTVYKNLNSPLLKDSGGIKQSYSILQLAADRRTASIISEITQTGTQIFKDIGDDDGRNTVLLNDSGIDNNPTDIPSIDDNGVSKTRSAQKDPPPIQNVDFLEWIKTYSGPKFTLIHCDFPYDVDYTKYAKSVTSTDQDYDFKGFVALTDALCANIDRIASYSSHVMFWFSMTFYEETKLKLRAAGLRVHDHPLIWFKTDNAGIIPGRGEDPRRVYETAFLCSRGHRPLVKPLANAYGAPSAPNSIHPSQKSEAVLNHFFSMLIDETTDVLDPTAGSGSALRAAESCGARSVLGLELNPDYAKAANIATLNARVLRKAAGQ